MLYYGYENGRRRVIAVNGPHCIPGDVQHFVDVCIPDDVWHFISAKWSWRKESGTAYHTTAPVLLTEQVPVVVHTRQYGANNQIARKDTKRLTRRSWRFV